MHLHRHAFVTRHVLDRAGCLATEEVAEIVARAASPDRRRPCTPGRERAIVAGYADSRSR